MKFIVRYRDNENIKEVEVDFNNCYDVYIDIKRKHIMADLLLIDDSNTEYCLM